jgi:mannose-6-phosphate isomerase-like protein (cupin superfamily)
MAGLLQVVSLDQAAGRLQRPFQVLRLIQIDDLAVEVYLCQGAVSWHRHLDEDELFMTFTGLVTLESEWGTVTLRPWEIALVPKGVAHRSLSAMRSEVLLLRPTQLTDRKNGHRRLYGITGKSRLAKASLIGAAERPAPRYRPQLLQTVEDYTMSMLRCAGTGPTIGPRSGDTLLLVHTGVLLLECTHGDEPLAAGQLARIPKHTSYRLISDRPSIVLELIRSPSVSHRHTSGMPSPGFIV